jgi:ribonuclease D
VTRSTDEARNRFDSMSVPGLSSRAQDAVNAALDAMSSWRSEAAESSEKNMKRVISKMAAAAAELGWPEQIVDTARTQLQNLTEMQIKTMDQMVEAWEEQLKSTNSASPSAMLSKMKSSAGSPASFPGADVFQMGMTSPLQFWMTCAGQWQKAWTDMMTTWTKAGRSFDQEGTRRH